MNRKWVSMLLSAIILIVLSACGSDDEGTIGAEDNGEVTISFYTWINEENGNWEEAIAAFEEEHPGIKVDLNVLVENMDNLDYLQNLDLEAASGENLDVMMFSSAQYLSQRISAGMVAPLDEYIENEGLDIEEEYTMAASPASSDGSYYGIPSKHNTYLVMLNKDHLDEAGLEIPTDWTWEDYKEYAKTLTTNDRYGSYLHSWPTFHHIVKLLGEPGENYIVKEDGSSNADHPMLEASLELRYELEQEDKSSEPYSNIISQQLNYRQQFFSQKASMIPIASYMLTEWGGFNPDFNIAWAPWPKNNEEDPIYTFTSADIMAVGNSSDNKDEAYEFIRWMTTEGMLVQNKSIPAWKNADLEEVVTSLAETTSNPEAVDIESLLHVLEVAEPTIQYFPAGYLTEMYNAFNAEAERYLLNEQDLETTMENVKQAVEAVVESNQ